MISAFLVFIVLGFITYIYFTISLHAFILKLDVGHTIEMPLSLIFSFALAPYLTSILLHYLLWLFPHQNTFVYIAIVLLSFTMLLIVSRSKIKVILHYIAGKLRFYETKDRANELIVKTSYFKIYAGERTLLFSNIIYWSILLIAVYYWIMQIIGTPISGHDMLEYAIQAKHFAREKLIDYIPNRYHAENNFFYVGLHGFSFPLIGTWEYLFSELFGKTDNDYLLRSVTGYYGFLIFALIYYFMKQYSRFYAMAAVVLLFSSYGFFITLTNYHIDTYRIFMITAAFSGLALVIKFPSKINLILFGVLTAAQAYIHSLGVFIALFLGLSFVIYYPGSTKQKITQSLILMLLITLFGGVHYIMDILFGTGWIFQEIKYY